MSFSDLYVIKIKPYQLEKYVTDVHGESVLLTSKDSVTRLLIAADPKHISDLWLTDFNLQSLPTNQELIDLYNIRNITDGHYLTSDYKDSKVVVGIYTLTESMKSYTEINLPSLLEFNKSFTVNILNHLKTDESVNKNLNWFYVERYEIVDN